MARLSSALSMSKNAVDPSLDALFSSSTKPVVLTKKPKYAQLVTPTARAPYTPKPVRELDEDEKNAEADESEEEDDDNEEEDDDDDEALSNDVDGDEATPTSVEERAEVKPASHKENDVRKRKRKARDDAEDLESKYLDQISREAAPSEKRLRRNDGGIEQLEGDQGQQQEQENEDKVEDAKEGQNEDDIDEPLIHESLLGLDANTSEAQAGDAKTEREKASRTVFLSNVSVEAVTSRAAKKTLMAHLVSMTSDPPAVVESLRFRSVPFSSTSLPKRAAFITKAVMGATAQAANAYVVYSTAAAARLAVRELNGSVVLERHLRADSVAHPSVVDHRRCVFVGNLGFMDDEVVEAEGGEGNTKKRFKVPMDVEEGLWRVFGKHAGPVESVRVVRDSVTRVGKGFAYVQFVDGTSVEAALLLTDRRFPPLLPRTLRVQRCMAPQKTATAVKKAGRAATAREEARKRTKYVPKLTAEQQTEAGRAAKLLGRAAASKDTKASGAAARVARAAGKPPGKSGAPLVFEGMRARAGQGGLPGKKGRSDRSKGRPGKRDHQTSNSKWKGKK